MMKTTFKPANKVSFFLDFADSLENADRVGSVTRILRYFNALAEDIGIDVLSPDYKDYSPKLKNGARHLPLPSFAKVNRHIAFLFISPIIFRNSLKESSLYWAKFSSSVPAVLAKKLFKKPLVNFFDYNWVELSGASKESKLEFKIKTAIERLMIRHSDYFITTTETLRSYLIEKGFKHPERIFVIPNYVDTELFCPCEKTQEPEVLNILSVGRLSEQKNFPLLIDGISFLLQRTDIKIKLTIVGSGPLRDDLLQQAGKFKLKLEIKERVANDRMPSIYQASDVFVMTSPREGHPRALVEAMACGLPVVGTNVVGIRDVITDRHNGLLCAENKEDIAEKILQIARNRSFTEKLSKNAREEAVLKYSFTALVERERTIYDQIFSNKQ